jgi:hypothetical protein
MASNFEELLLQKLKVTVAAEVSPQVAETLTVNTDLSMITELMLVRLKAFVLAEPVAPETITGHAWATFTHPANWREHWKDDHAGTWYGRLVLRIWPLKPRDIERRRATYSRQLDRYRTYPQATIRVPPSLGSVVRVIVPRETHWSEFIDPTQAES